MDAQPWFTDDALCTARSSGERGRVERKDAQSPTLVEFVDATLEGPRLRARKVEGTPAGDWLSVSSEVAVLDIRALFRTDDGAVVAMHMFGRADATKFRSGGPVTVAATFEADDTKLRWLNLAVVAGAGGLAGPDRVTVELFEVR